MIDTNSMKKPRLGVVVHKAGFPRSQYSSKLRPLEFFDDW